MHREAAFSTCRARPGALARLANVAWRTRHVAREWRMVQTNRWPASDVHERFRPEGHADRRTQQKNHNNEQRQTEQNAGAKKASTRAHP
jgi:hypothetical protein